MKNNESNIMKKFFYKKKHPIFSKNTSKKSLNNWYKFGPSIDSQH